MWIQFSTSANKEWQCPPPHLAGNASYGEKMKMNISFYLPITKYYLIYVRRSKTLASIGLLFFYYYCRRRRCLFYLRWLLRKKRFAFALKGQEELTNPFTRCR